MKKALITGISGFVGSHLAEYLLAQELEVYGFAHPDHSKENLKDVIKKLHLTDINLLEKERVHEYFKKNVFDYVFHLAAFSSPSQSFSNPTDTINNNVFAQLNLLEALKNSQAKILIVGSSEEYGNAFQKGHKISEQNELRPESPYALSKTTQDLMGYQYFCAHGSNIVRVRPFNHIGPRQSKVFVVPAFAAQIAQIEKQGKGSINVGNLDNWRDFTDVRDMVRAYLMALENGVPGEVYNIGSGNLFKIEDILNKLLSFTKANISVNQDKSLVRSKDLTGVCADFMKFKKISNWEPTIPIEKTLLDTLNFERDKLN